jgi:hypothetical protein
MAKKPTQEVDERTAIQEETSAVVEETPITDNNSDLGFEASAEDSGMADFDSEAEYKPTPLIPKGQFFGNVTKVAYNKEDVTIDWNVAFEGNGEEFTLQDGETPLDGSTINYRNWLPKPGDEKELTKTGRQTKRQAKVNMWQDFKKDMRIMNAGTSQQILEAIANQDWLGLRVKVTIGFRTFEGRVFNSADKMIAA